jgi:hypothetical protein
VTLEAAQDVERPRHHLDHIALACEIAGEHSLLAEPFRASSHVLWLHSAMRNKIPLAEQTTSGNLPLQQKAEGIALRSTRIPIMVRAALSPEKRNARNQDCHRSSGAYLRASC